MCSNYSGIKVLCCGGLECSEKVTSGKGKRDTFVHCLPRSCWYLCNSLAACALAAAFEASFSAQADSRWDQWATVILAAGMPLICLSGVRSRDATFPPRLLLREKDVSDQYLGKYNTRVYCVIYDRVKFHTVLQVIWNVFALACPLTALG